MSGVGARLIRVAVLVFASTGALGQPAICADLERQLANVASGGSSAGPSAAQVARRLIKQQAAAGANGCARYNPSKPETALCPGILAEMNRLRAELALAQTGEPSVGVSRATIRTRLVQYGCAGQSAAAATSVNAGGAKPPAGGVRTLCVRRCDGYFFPIGNASRRDRYKIDAEACQSMYAETGEAELFIQLRRDDPASAVSVDGKQRYAEQPYAFAFRQELNGACHARLKAGLDALAARYFEALRTVAPKAGAGLDSPETRPPPIPHLRPIAVGEDPETVANRAGASAPSAAPAPEPQAVASTWPVRYVGPAYYVELYDLGRRPVTGPTHRPPLGFDLLGIAMTKEADLVWLSTQ